MAKNICRKKKPDQINKTFIQVNDVVSITIPDEIITDATNNIFTTTKRNKISRTQTDENIYAIQYQKRQMQKLPQYTYSTSDFETQTDNSNDVFN